VPASALATELLELVRPAARELGGAEVLARIDPAACESDLQLLSQTAAGAAADVTVRSLV
jgi:hypothetical protein